MTIFLAQNVPRPPDNNVVDPAPDSTPLHAESPPGRSGRMHACRYGMAIIRLNGRRTARKGREDENGAESRKKDRSHNFVWFTLLS
jgi:hypothetical protein